MGPHTRGKSTWSLQRDTTPQIPSSFQDFRHFSVRSAKGRVLLDTTSFEQFNANSRLHQLTKKINNNEKADINIHCYNTKLSK